MTSKAERAAELAAVLSAEAHFVQSSPSLRPPLYAVPPAHQIAHNALALMRLAAGVARWAVLACNGIERYQGNGIVCGTWTEADEAAKERADARALAKATEIAARYGATVTIGGDPRGYVLRLVLASGRTNTMGNDGWGIA